MHRTRVKICGVCRPEDAVAAANAGADAVGMVFNQKAARRVNVPQAKAITAMLPPFVTPVGLFIGDDDDLAIMRIVLIAVRLDAVQLLGDADPAIAQSIPKPIIKALHPDAEQLRKWNQSNVPNLRGIVLDSVPGKGGTGIENNWTAIEKLQRENLLSKYPLIVAGGLNPQNVAGVIRRLRPYAVDVSSGVDGNSKREKSADKIRAFIQAVRQADSEINS